MQPDPPVTRPTLALLACLASVACSDTGSGGTGNATASHTSTATSDTTGTATGTAGPATGSTSASGSTGASTGTATDAGGASSVDTTTVTTADAGATTGSTTGSGGNAGFGGDTANSSTGGATTGATTSTGGAGGAGGNTAGFQPCPSDGAVCKVMPFGDSITDGYGVAGGYRVELFRLALGAEKNISFVGSGSNGPSDVEGVPFPPNHEGHSGYTIEPETGRSGISPLVSTVMPQYTPHIVLLMIGTNDAIDDIDMQDAPMRLGALIDSIYDELPDILMIVARPIPSRDDALNTRLLTYGEAIPAVVQARADAGRHIDIVDMYPVISDDPNYKNTLLQDEWHPNAAGHALIGAEWFSALERWW